MTFSYTKPAPGGDKLSKFGALKKTESYMAKRPNRNGYVDPRRLNPRQLAVHAKVEDYADPRRLNPKLLAVHANAGDALAAIQLAQIYEFGYGHKLLKSVEERLALLAPFVLNNPEFAKFTKHPFCAYLYGTYLIEQDPKNWDGAKQIVTQDIEHAGGLAAVGSHLGTLVVARFAHARRLAGVKRRDDVWIEELYRQTLSKKDPTAAFLLAQLLEKTVNDEIEARTPAEGTGLSVWQWQMYNERASLFLQAADSGNVEAQIKVAIRFKSPISGFDIVKGKSEDTCVRLVINYLERAWQQGSLRAKFWLALYYEELKQYDAARRTYQEILDNSPRKLSDIETHSVENNLAVIHDQTGDYQRAFDIYLRLFETDYGAAICAIAEYAAYGKPSINPDLALALRACRKSFDPDIYLGNQAAQALAAICDDFLPRLWHQTSSGLRRVADDIEPNKEMLLLMPVDRAEAAQWLRGRIAEQPTSDLHYALAGMEVLHGNEAAAVQNYDAAARRGRKDFPSHAIDLATKLAEAARDGDPAAALDYYIKASRLGSSDANDKAIGICLAEVVAADAINDVDHAQYWYVNAVELGSDDAALAILQRYLDGTMPFPEDLQSHLGMDTDTDTALAHALYADLYQGRDVFSRRQTLALNDIRSRLAPLIWQKQDLITICLCPPETDPREALGLIHLPRDNREAFDVLRPYENSQASADLAMVFARREAQDQNYAKALNWYDHADAKGHNNAQQEAIDFCLRTAAESDLQVTARAFLMEAEKRGSPLATLVILENVVETRSKPPQEWYDRLGTKYVTAMIYVIATELHAIRDQFTDTEQQRLDKILGPAVARVWQRLPSGGVSRLYTPTLLPLDALVIPSSSDQEKAFELLNQYQVTTADHAEALGDLEADPYNLDSALDLYSLAHEFGSKTAYQKARDLVVSAIEVASTPIRALEILEAIKDRGLDFPVLMEIEYCFAAADHYGDRVISAEILCKAAELGSAHALLEVIELCHTGEVSYPAGYVSDFGVDDPETLTYFLGTELNQRRSLLTEAEQGRFEAIFLPFARRAWQQAPSGMVSRVYDGVVHKGNGFLLVSADPAEVLDEFYELTAQAPMSLDLAHAIGWHDPDDAEAEPMEGELAEWYQNSHSVNAICAVFDVIDRWHSRQHPIPSSWLLARQTDVPENVVYELIVQLSENSEDLASAQRAKLEKIRTEMLRSAWVMCADQALRPIQGGLEGDQTIAKDETLYFFPNTAAGNATLLAHRYSDHASLDVALEVINRRRILELDPATLFRQLTEMLLPQNIAPYGTSFSATCKRIGQIPESAPVRERLQTMWDGLAYELWRQQDSIERDRTSGRQGISERDILRWNRTLNTYAAQFVDGQEAGNVIPFRCNGEQRHVMNLRIRDGISRHRTRNRLAA